jgi:hypothetical protein
LLSSCLHEQGSCKKAAHLFRCLLPLLLPLLPLLLPLRPLLLLLPLLLRLLVLLLLVLLLPQMRGVTYNNQLHAFQSIWAKEGMRGFYR